MPQPLVQKNQIAIDVKTILGYRIGSGDADQFITKRRRNRFVRIENENPRRSDRQVVQRPVFLPRITLPGVINELRAMVFGDLLRAVARAAVQNEHVFSPIHHARQSEGKIDLLVLGGDENGDRSTICHANCRLYRWTD